MRSKVEKSPNRDGRTLKVCMKKVSNVRTSPVNLLKTTRKGNILTPMTSTVHKKGVVTSSNEYQESLHDNTKLISISENDISGIAPLGSGQSKSSLLDLTPKITISQSSNVPKKTVPRKTVKSPMNNNRISSRKSKTEDLELQLKKKCGEIIALNRKVNKLEETLSDKNKMIKDLEIRFPKMLSEMSRGLGQDPQKLKVSMELKETMKRNRQLSGSQKRNEEMLKVKDEKIKQAQRERDKALDDLRDKERDYRDVKGRLMNLEQRLPQMIHKLEDKELELRRVKNENEELRYKLTVINEENFSKMIELEKMSTEIVDLNLNIEEKDNDYEMLEEKHESLIANHKAFEVKIQELEAELAKALETVKKQAETSLLNPNQTHLISFDSTHIAGSKCSPVFEEDEEMLVDQVFPNHSNMSCLSIINASNASDSEYDVSAGTIAKVGFT